MERPEVSYNAKRKNRYETQLLKSTQGHKKATTVNNSHSNIIQLNSKGVNFEDYSLFLNNTSPCNSAIKEEVTGEDKGTPQDPGDLILPKDQFHQLM